MGSVVRPHDWQTKKLGEVCDFFSGLWKGKETPYIEVGVIRNTNFTKEGKLDDSNIAYLDVEKRQFEKRKLVYGDIILEKSGGGPKQPVGRVIIFDKKEGDFSFSNFTSAIRVKNPSELDFNFLHKFLFFSYISGITEIMQSHSIGIRNLDTKLYKEIEISLPPLFEQHRIVKILDEVFEGVAKAKENAEKNLKNAKELFESYLQSFLTNSAYEIKTLGELCISFEYGSSSKSKSNGKIPVLRMGNIQDGRFVWGKLAYSDNDIEIKKYLLRHNDVLFNRTNSPELVGKTAVYKGEMPAIFAGYLIRINRNENLLDADYLNYFLNSNIAKDYGKTVVISSVNQANINGTKLKGYPIPAPTLFEQKSFVAKLDALSAETKKLEAIYKQKLANLEELKKSVLKKAFAGEL